MYREIIIEHLDFFFCNDPKDPKSFVLKGRLLFGMRIANTNFYVLRWWESFRSFMLGAKWKQISKSYIMPNEFETEDVKLFKNNLLADAETMIGNLITIKNDGALREDVFVYAEHIVSDLSRDVLARPCGHLTLEIEDFYFCKIMEDGDRFTDLTGKHVPGLRQFVFPAICASSNTERGLIKRDDLISPMTKLTICSNL